MTAATVANDQDQMADFLRSLPHEQLVEVALNLYADAARLRRELDEETTRGGRGPPTSSKSIWTWPSEITPCRCSCGGARWVSSRSRWATVEVGTQHFDQSSPVTAARPSPACRGVPRHPRRQGTAVLRWRPV